MQKKSFLLLVAALFMLKATAQQVQEIQQTVITKRTATWCPPCGSWGWDLFEELIADNNDKAILIAAHHSGLLTTDAGKEMTDNWGAFGQPRFYLNEADQGATSSNASSVRNSIKTQVDDAYSSSPVVNVGFQPVYADGAVRVDAKVKFFQPANGEYYLGIYLIENGVVEFQQNQGDDAVHDKVLRYSFTNSTWGDIVANGAVDAGEGFTRSYELEIGDPTGYNYEVVGIIWQKDGELYRPVNAWSTGQINTSTAVAQVAKEIDMTISPTVTNTAATVLLNLPAGLQHARIEVINIIGQVITELHDGPLGAGSHRFALTTDRASLKGVHYVRYSDGKSVATRQVVFQ